MDGRVFTTLTIHASSCISVLCNPSTATLHRVRWERSTDGKKMFETRSEGGLGDVVWMGLVISRESRVSCPLRVSVLGCSKSVIQRPSWASNLILAGFLNAQEIISNQENSGGFICLLPGMGEILKDHCGQRPCHFSQTSASLQPDFCIRFLQHTPYEDASSTWWETDTHGHYELVLSPVNARCLCSTVCFGHLLPWFEYVSFGLGSSSSPRELVLSWLSHQLVLALSLEGC